MIHPLVLGAILFAFITGANDGASLLATNLESKAFGPARGLIILTVFVILGPFLLGTAVATTLAHGLVNFGGQAGAGPLLLAVLVAVGVIFFLGRRGLPSSVTQALTGAIVGAGLGLGYPVDWWTVGRVVLILFVTPVVAGGLSALLIRLINEAGPHGDIAGHLRRLNAGSFLLSAVAYAANDAQKMVAVFAVALGSLAANGSVIATIPAALIIGALWAAGTIFGLGRLGHQLGDKLLPVRGAAPIAAGFGAATAVIGSALLGSPVSMAQANTTGLVAATVTMSGWRTVRLDQVLRIAGTWILTLPAALILAAVAGLVSRAF